MPSDRRPPGQKSPWQLLKRNNGAPDKRNRPITGARPPEWSTLTPAQLKMMREVYGDLDVTPWAGWGDGHALKPDGSPATFELGPYGAAYGATPRYDLGITTPRITGTPSGIIVPDRPVITIQRTPHMTATLPEALTRVVGDRPLSGVTSRFFEELEREVYGTIGDAIIRHDAEITEKLKKLDSALKTGCYTLEIREGDKVGQIEGIRHKQLDELLSVATQRIPVMLVGMAGTGKSHACEQIAGGLNLPFYAMSVGAQTSKSDIIGFVHAGGEYVPTLFRQAYEHGGVFLMDEIDAGNANVLILINAALANGYCAFPGGMVKQHEDFVFVASANTFGNGANRQYVGRNQLDAATLDRFALIEWDIDEALEASLAGTSHDGKAWLSAVKRVRSKVTSEGMRVLVTPRATQRGAKLLAAGVPMEKAGEIALFNLFPSDKRQWARDIAKLPGSKADKKSKSELF